MDRRIRRILSLQLALLLVASLGAYAIWGLGVAKAVWFGAGIAAANTIMIAWRMRPGRAALAQPSLSEFYRSWLERYLLAGVLLAAGLGGLKLMPLGLLSGFILGQVIWIIAPLTVEAGSRDTEEK
ncbi:MAG: hypothetical protein A2Z44_03805 [Betaproteobacteria bacterium RBG_19FT_COMBO_58_11]|nr:MAG: hypothetical protein A2Z44_03805 [Betaproteobacteria bacterium RBG_19FT_COMBO_58_11]